MTSAGQQHPTTNIESHQSNEPPPPEAGATTLNEVDAAIAFSPAGPVVSALSGTATW